MEGVDTGTEISSQKEPLVFEKRAPRLTEISASGLKRENIVESFKLDEVTRKPMERTFTEKQGIDDLIAFLDLGIKTAQEKGDSETLKKMQLFKENIAYVGEPELKAATQGIARHLIELAQKGKDIIIYPANVRSERYISLRIMEEVDYLTEEKPELRNRFKISQNSFEIAEQAKSIAGNCEIVVPDDFVVSGTRIKGFAGGMIYRLKEAGFSSEKAMEMVEADVVAVPERPGKKGLEYGNEVNEKQRYLNIFSYYSVPEYEDDEKRVVVFSGVSMTGSHSSTDYGFETELEKIQKYLKDNKVGRDLPLLHMIKRPYEIMDTGPVRYKDEDLQKRWEKVLEKYELKNNKT